MLALDFALIVRHSLNKLNLSLATRGVAYTLAFRIGTNICTWISQEALAKELGVSESNVRIHCNKLKKECLLLIKKDAQDKRKNLYSFNSKIFNYAQMNEEEREKCRLLLGDTLRDTAYFQAVNSAYKQAVIISPIGMQDDEIKEEKTVEKLPKRKLKEHKEHKEKRKSVDNFVIPLWLDEELWDQFKMMRKTILKAPISQQGEKLLITKLEKLNNEGHDPNELLSEAIINNWKSIWVTTPKKIKLTKNHDICLACRRPEQNCSCPKQTAPWFTDNH